MPLPTNTSVSLQGYSRPGDAVQSKPKQAILVRLTAEALDALEAVSVAGSGGKLQVQFGHKPGIYINGRLFPVRAQQETTPHEMYVRAIQPNKPAPLKLSGAVTGRFLVQPAVPENTRDVEDETAEISHRLQERRREEQQKREKGRIQVIDEPFDLKPLTSTTKRKRPGSGSGTAPTRPRSTLETGSANAVGSSRKTSPLPPSTSATTSSRATPPVVVKASPDVRLRVVRYLAQYPGGSTDDVLHRVGRGASQEILDSIAAVLPEIAEHPPGTKSKGTWTLKPRTYCEVRPYEWSNLSTGDRTRIAQDAKKALSTLRIPPSDPVWHHFREPVASPLPPAIATAASSSSSGSSSRHGLPPGLPAKPAPEVVNGGNAPVSSQASATGTPVPTRPPNGTTTIAKKLKPSATASKVKLKEREVPVVAKDEGARAGAMRTSASDGALTKPRRPATGDDTDDDASRVRKLTAKPMIKARSPQPPSTSTAEAKHAIPSSRSDPTALRTKLPAREERDRRREYLEEQEDAAARRKRPAPSGSAPVRASAPSFKRKSSEEGELDDDEPGEIVAPAKKRRVIDSSGADGVRAQKVVVPRPSAAPSTAGTGVSGKAASPAPVKATKHRRDESVSTVSSTTRERERERGRERDSDRDKIRQMAKDRERERQHERLAVRENDREQRERDARPTGSKRRRGSTPEFTSTDEDSAPLKTKLKAKAPPRGASPPPPRSKVKYKDPETSSNSTSNGTAARRGASPPPKVRRREEGRGTSPLPPTLSGSSKKGKAPELPASLPLVKAGGENAQNESARRRVRYERLHARYLALYGQLQLQHHIANRLLNMGSGSEESDSDEEEGELLDAERLKRLVQDVQSYEKKLRKMRAEAEAEAD